MQASSSSRTVIEAAVLAVLLSIIFVLTGLLIFFILRAQRRDMSDRELSSESSDARKPSSRPVLSTSIDHSREEPDLPLDDGGLSHPVGFNDMELSLEAEAIDALCSTEGGVKLVDTTGGFHAQDTTLVLTDVQVSPGLKHTLPENQL